MNKVINIIQNSLQFFLSQELEFCSNSKIGSTLICNYFSAKSNQTKIKTL